MQLRAVAVKGVETIAARSAHPTLRRKPFDGLHDVEDPAAHRASVHAQRAADRAGDAFKELEALPAFARGEAAEFLEAGAAADAEAALTEVGDRAPMGRIKVQDEAVVTFVGHEEIGTAAEREPTQVKFRGGAQECDDVIHVRRFGVPARGAAKSERRVAGERFVGAQGTLRREAAGDEVGEIERKDVGAPAAEHLSVGFGVAFDVARAHEGHNRIGAGRKFIQDGRQRPTVLDETMRGAGDDGVGAAAFDGRFPGGIDRQHEGMVGDGERIAEFTRILARARVAVRLEDNDESASVGLAHPLEQRGDLRGVVRVVGEHAESRTLEEDVLAATDTAPASQRLGDESTGDEMRDRERQRSVRTVEGARDRQIELTSRETPFQRDYGGRVAALDETERIVSAITDADDRHFQADDEALEAFVADGDDHRGTGTFEERAEDAFERGFIAVVVRMVPVEVHRHGDVGREGADRAVALVDLGHDPGRRSRGARWREGRVAEKPAEDVTEIGFGAGEGGDE